MATDSIPKAFTRRQFDDYVTGDPKKTGFDKSNDKFQALKRVKKGMLSRETTLTPIDLGKFVKKTNTTRTSVLGNNIIDEKYCFEKKSVTVPSEIRDNDTPIFSILPKETFNMSSNPMFTSTSTGGRKSRRNNKKKSTRRRRH